METHGVVIIAEYRGRTERQTYVRKETEKEGGFRMVNDTTESFYFLFIYLFLYVMQLRHWVVEYETTATEVVTNMYDNVQSKSENCTKIRFLP